MGEDKVARELTEAVMRHYGYTDDDLAAAEAVHPGRACDNDECYDEDGKSIHGPAHTELWMTADVMVEVVSPIVAAHVARATADAEIVRAECERQYDYAVEAAERFRKRAADAEAGHECGRDFDPSCSGCVTAMSDAYGSDRSRWEPS